MSQEMIKLIQLLVLVVSTLGIFINSVGFSQSTTDYGLMKNLNKNDVLRIIMLSNMRQELVRLIQQVVIAAGVIVLMIVPPDQDSTSLFRSEVITFAFLFVSITASALSITGQRERSKLDLVTGLGNMSINKNDVAKQDTLGNDSTNKV